MEAPNQSMPLSKNESLSTIVELGLVFNLFQTLYLYKSAVPSHPQLDGYTSAQGWVAEVTVSPLAAACSRRSDRY